MRMGTIYSKVDGMIHYKTELPKTLYPFYSYSFSSGGTIGSDFKSFNTKFRNFIKKNLPNGYSIHYWNRGHYYCSGVIKDPIGRFIYFSIPDVRFFKNEWATNILIRTMKHDKDWTGGNNNYTDVFNFSDSITKLYK
jgi:hypothetical protein